MSQRGGRSHFSQIIVPLALLTTVIQCPTAKPSSGINQTSEILVRRFSNASSSGEAVPKIFKLTQNGQEEVEEPLFTLKSDRVNVQADFKTVNVKVLNRLKDKEIAKKVANVQKDLQSRIKIHETETTSTEATEVTPHIEPIDPEEVKKKQARVKEDIESRLFSDDGFLGFRSDDSYLSEKQHYPVKRSDDDYYADEPMPEHKSSTTNLPAKEESFFSIFESLFGSSDDESQTKKKAKPEDEPVFEDPEDETIKENIKTVGDILKPLKPAEEDPVESKNAYVVYQTDAPEYRIVNNFHSNQASNKNGYNPSEPKPNYQNSYKTVTDKPFQPFRPHSASDYEDYDLEEFLDKTDAITPVKYVPPVTTLSSDPTSSTTTTPTTTIKLTTKNQYNKLKFPSVQKKNDYINRNRYQEANNEVTDKRVEKETESTIYTKPQEKPTTERQYPTKSHLNYLEIKKNEVKPQKIQESPNFYNLINLPVRYSTKDTAIPLISTSYANTKIQGMGAHKYEKGSIGKYPNHKYDPVYVSTTKKPNYWATKRTEGTSNPTEATTATYKFSSSVIDKVTTKYLPTSEKIDFDVKMTGSGSESGSYGVKKTTEIKSQTQPDYSSSIYTYNKDQEPEEKEKTKTEEVKHETLAVKNNVEPENLKVKEVLVSSVKPEKNLPEDYDYDVVPARVEELNPSNEKYVPQGSYAQASHKNEVEYNKNTNTVYKETISSGEESELPEYEYYDYDFEMSTTTSTTTTSTSQPKIKVKYPSLPKDKLKIQLPVEKVAEKVAVVVPSKNHNFYEGISSESNKPTTVVVSSVQTDPTFTTTIKQTTTLKPTQVTTKATQPETTTQYRRQSVQVYKPNLVSNQPLPLFEKVEKQEKTTTKFFSVPTTQKPTTQKPTTVTPTTEPTPKPFIVTSLNNRQQEEQESNVNILLVPTKETIKNSVKVENKFSPPEPPSTVNHALQPKPSGSFYSDYTTEFTVGAVHGHNGNPNNGNPSYQKPVNHPEIQGHFVSSSISINPYGDDEPFRPIPKPSGLPPNYQPVQDEVKHQLKLQQKTPVMFQSKRPVAQLLNSENKSQDPGHEPHEFIPSPQFHRPAHPKPAGDIRPPDLDYDFEGIQTEPKPGQYVIFSKPQLNPELNENQLKKKPEINNLKQTVSNFPHFQDENRFAQETQEHVIFNPKEGQFYHQTPSVSKPLIAEKPDQGRPIFENSEEELPLELVPPRNTQTEKPFDRNFGTSEVENKESSLGYPRPHWEKNGKPSFLMNKNDMIRLPSVAPHVVPTLVPPSNLPPLRFRRPTSHPSNMSPIRKNFNEASTNVKPKTNLPNILPQFRPNTKMSSGPYHRPYIGSNRRNGMNRYHDKEHGNFPYHIQYPDKESVLHRDFEMAPEIVPKFITNRGKVPSELWTNHGMQKRFGQTLTSLQIKPDEQPQDSKILRRFQRTPVTTLQMLKQMSGVETQKTPFTREDHSDPSASLVPPIYRTFPEQTKNEENLYIVYPSKVPQKLYPDHGKVFIVSDTKNQKLHNFTKTEEQNPLFNSNKRENNVDDKSNIDFPYGFVRSEETSQLVRKQSKDNESITKAVKATNSAEEIVQEYKGIPEQASKTKEESIDMNLHLQSNNQWNEVQSTSQAPTSQEKTSESILGNHSEISEYAAGSESIGEQVDPPSEYQTSITEKDSAFTLGTVMHAMSQADRKGQVASVPLHNGEKQLNRPQLSVNERISNGKIITVSMPLDVKKESEVEEDLKNQSFQAPFQASLSVNGNDTFSTHQGWTVVKNPDERVEAEEKIETTAPTTTRFSFENFKPELIGGFKPIYELPEQPEQTKPVEKSTEREEKTLVVR